MPGIRIFVNEMLKFIDGDAIGQEVNGADEVGVEVFILIFVEEPLHPRPSEKFHAHRMDFSFFHRRVAVLGQLDVARTVALEGVSYFVGQDVDVARSAVEV